MATIQVYHEENNRTYQVNVVLNRTLLSDGSGSAEEYLLISTTIRKADGTAFGTYRVKDLTDVPPGYPTASDFTELVNDYIEYFMDQAQLGQSSSSSSLSSSSSSFGITSSSSSSSSPSSQSSPSSESSSSTSESSESSSSTSDSSESSSSSSSL